MTPEILHRCPSCGASTRDFGASALFCPECGQALAETGAEKAEVEVHQTGNPAVAAETVVAPPITWSGQGEPPTIDAPPAEDKSNKPVTEDRHGARERTRETLQRASNRARGAIEDKVKRAEKIHHVSTVMLEEAASDPSLRFVLVALALFVIFVILLVLSKVMG